MMRGRMRAGLASACHARRSGSARRGSPCGPPWGDRFDPSLCNSGSDDTTPVDQHPGGVSCHGILDMAVNVWEWTESERDDGHTRYAIICGGSHLKVEGSIWYNASGVQPNDCHEKMLLMYPGLDRCATIGFRCVKDMA